MAEEIFRFSIVRNPQTIPTEQLGDAVLPLVTTDDDQAHPSARALINLRRDNGTRAAILAAAERVIREPRFMARLEQLRTPLWTFAEPLASLRNPNDGSVRTLVKKIFGNDAASVAASAEFKDDVAAITDAIVVVSVVSPPVPGLRSRLLQARRAAELIATLSASANQPLSTARIQRILTATVLLPSTLFPLPDNTRERQEENRKVYEERKSQLDERRARAQDILNEVARNAAVIEEVSGALTEHLFDARTRPDAAAPVSRTLSVLPPSRVEKLSPRTKAVISDDLGLSREAVDAAHVSDRLEKRNTHLNDVLAGDLRDVVIAEPVHFPVTCGECKPVVLPPPKAENSFVPDTRGKVEIVGTQDLLIVRQDLLEYRAGEIAHIENVLEGEKKGKRHRKLHRTEVSLVEEHEREEEVEEELQTTDKYELQTETSRVMNEDRSLEAGVTVSASYGPVEIQAHGNYAQSSSLEESRRAASTFARDVVSRSLQRIRERVMTRRSRTEITEVEIINRHSLENPAGTGHIRGVYRWVNKYYKAQIVNYGKRTMLEFMVPEPAAFYKFAQSKKTGPRPTVPKPERPGFCRNGVFHPLTPSDLQPENYMCFVGMYNVKNVNAPSPRYVKLSDVLKYKIDNTGSKPVVFAETNDSFKAPEGYLPKAVSYLIAGGNSHSATTKSDGHDDIVLAVITIGDRKVYRYYKSEIGKVGGQDFWPDKEQVIEWGNPLSTRETDFGSYAVGELAGAFPVDPSNADPEDNPNVVKVSLTGHTTLPLSISVHYSVLCERSAARFQQWQIETFNAILDAYLTLKQEYDSSQQGQDLASLVNIQGRNPLLNREVEKRELKKFSISLLTGQQFESFNAMEQDYVSQIPQINLLDAAAEGTFVRFFEQALEWRHLTYVLYPYFWGNKNGWGETVTLQDTDPIFEQFLQAGYARVWVPVRPGFERVIAHYITCGGEPWAEHDAPLCGDGPAESEPVIAMIDEIKEQLGADFESRPGTLALENGKALAVGSGTDFSANDVDREILIALKTYRIVAVDEAAQEIRLGEPYPGPDADAAHFAVGVKFVGEPWVVQVPTNLVYLEDGTSLIST